MEFYGSAFNTMKGPCGPPLGHKILVVITRWSHYRGLQKYKMTQWFLRLVWKNMAVITRWSHKRGGRKAGFHFRFHCIFDRNRNLFFWKSEFVYVNWNLFWRIGSKTNSDFRKQLRFSKSFSKTNSDFRRQTPIFEKQTSGGVHPYISFGHKMGIDCPFWSGIGYGFRGNYGSVWTYLSFQFQMSKKERGIFEFEREFKKSFLLLFESE